MNITSHQTLFYISKKQQQYFNTEKMSGKVIKFQFMA